ncbi:putative FAE1/Type III polyketide synthase-like protein [Helianthus debilis subsp. tardiflorus]|nr:putative FAE1/Type III polyketide synthase-like protein [Helianthus annuus]
MEHSPLSIHRRLQIIIFSLLSFAFLLHATHPIAAAFLRFLTAHLLLTAVTTLTAVILLILHLGSRPHPVLLLNHSCFQPPPNRKCTYELANNFLLHGARFTTEEPINFMRNIYFKSGLGDETYAPPFMFEKDQIPTLKNAVQEAEEGIFSAVDSLLAKTKFSPEEIDVVIVTCGSFSPSPSLSALVVNRYKLRPDVKTYNLSGMGCSSGVLSIDLAYRILRGGGRKIQNALVVITESITLNWYDGEERSMLVTNCIFRVGCAAAMITNDPSRRTSAKMELIHTLRTHHGASDSSYRAAFQEEDGKGITGVSLTKDLIRVAGLNLRQHIKILAPRVLPLSQLVRYVYSVLTMAMSGGQLKPTVPDFTTAFKHICVHTGGKAVIEQVGRVLKFDDSVTEPARMTLNRFGNTSSSLVFYELSYFEAKGRIKKGDKMWMIAFGTGFKVCSLVWKCIRDPEPESDNPWNDSIHKYPLKVW